MGDVWQSLQQNDAPIAKLCGLPANAKSQSLSVWAQHLSNAKGPLESNAQQFVSSRALAAGQRFWACDHENQQQATFNNLWAWTLLEEHVLVTTSRPSLDDNQCRFQNNLSSFIWHPTGLAHRSCDGPAPPRWAHSWSRCRSHQGLFCSPCSPTDQ